MAGLIEKDIRLMWCNKQALILFLIIGIDGEINVSKEEKAKRVKILLETVQYLYRDIRGRRENLSPLFIIGGNYERKNPFFENIVKIDNNMINVDTLVEMKESREDLENSTIVGVTSGIFNNDSQIKEKLGAVTIAEAFEEFKKKVDEYYA